MGITKLITELEDRYLVIKITDVVTALKSKHEYSYSYQRLVDAYETLIAEVNSVRAKMGKLPSKYVVIGEDWPEYIPTKAMLLNRINAEKCSK